MSLGRVIYPTFMTQALEEGAEGRLGLVESFSPKGQVKSRNGRAASKAEAILPGKTPANIERWPVHRSCFPAHWGEDWLR